ncbi:MAG TPA: cbb3-type cytochrome oxidase assembly protein CcoS [Burkholderiaceae bacterium]|nr:cbb3-type cytochrome oxidase assembly protein CcoS [Burkholderiaceae bacterium]
MMESLYLLLPLSVVFVIAIGAAFWWAIFSGQFDDVQRAADAVLADDDSTDGMGRDAVARVDADSDLLRRQEAGKQGSGTAETEV